MIDSGKTKKIPLTNMKCPKSGCRTCMHWIALGEGKGMGLICINNIEKKRDRCYFKGTIEEFGGKEV